MRFLKLANWTFIIFSLLTLSHPALAAFPTQFSATQTIHSAGQTLKGKMFVDQGKVRLEQNMSGMQMVTIMRPDKGVMYQIMPGNMYMEMPMTAAQANLPAGAMTPGQFGAEPLAENLVGTETVNGIECEKYKINAGQPGEVTLWVAKESHLPVKTEMANGLSGAEWSDLIVGPQKAELFELPAGFTKMDTAGMMKGMNLPQGSLPQNLPTDLPTN